MSTFFTALLWGAGVSTGATLGIVGWFITIELCKWLRGDTETKRKTDDHNERALAELKRRNEWTQGADTLRQVRNSVGPSRLSNVCPNVNSEEATDLLKRYR